MICTPNEIIYSVADDGKSITFQPCGHKSYHPKDVEHRYCSRCHRFMALLELARQLLKEEFDE
jgi:hypothetical protein